MEIPDQCLRYIYYLDEVGHETTENGQVHTVVINIARQSACYRCPCGRFFKRYYDWREVMLRERLDPPELGDVRCLAIDEFALRRRHEYATIFLGLKRNRVLWICKTRTKEAVVDVFRNIFGLEACARIESVAMDMWEAYGSAVRECLPRAEIVRDLYHIVKNYNREVVDRVRVDEAKACSMPEERKVMKGSRFILLKNRRNMRREEVDRLKDLLAVNRRLFTVHLMREALTKTWQYIYEKPAREWF